MSGLRSIQRPHQTTGRGRRPSRRRPTAPLYGMTLSVELVRASSSDHNATLRGLRTRMRVNSALRGRRSWAAAFTIAGLVSCTGDEARISIQFVWETEPPPPNTHVVKAEVIAPDGRRTPSDAVPYRPGIALNLPRVPFGRDLVVQVTLFEDTIGDPLVRYFGRSAPFDFAPGDEIRITVNVGLVDAPEILDARVRDAERNVVGRPQLEIEIRSRGADRFELAQDSSWRSHRSVSETPWSSSPPSTGLRFRAFRLGR